jgi:hypothetical protein
MTRTASDRRGVRGSAALGIALSVVTLASSPTGAQAPEPVSLRIGPPVGETVRMRLDQRVEMSGTTRMAAGDSTATVVTTLVVISRAFVERRDRDATVLLTSTDSVAAASTGADSMVIAEETRRALQGKRVRLRVAPDGATEILGKGIDGTPELSAIFSQMPATLPNMAVPVGYSWSRVMVAPIDPSLTTQGEGGKLSATFRLDSLSRNGDRAFVSVSGTLSRAPGVKYGQATMTLSGSMTGGFVIDRRRGWISDARLTYTVRSTVMPSNGNAADAMRFRMKVTQWVRVVQ